MNDSLPPLRRYRLRLIGCAVALLLAALIFWALRPSGPDPRLDAIRQKGYPVTLAELDAWYTHVPDSQNVALIYLKVLDSAGFTNLTSQLDPIITGRNWPPPRTQHLSSEDKADLSALLSTNEALLRPFYAAVGPCRYPVDLNNGFNALVPYLARCKSGVNVLLTTALLHAESGESEQALEDFRAAAHLADSLREEPLLISQLVRFACWNLIFKRMETVLNLESLNDQQLARLQQLIEPANCPQSMSRAMAGERTSALSVFADPGSWLTGRQGSTASLPTGERLRVAALAGAFRLSGFFAKDKAFYLDVMATNVAAGELPFPERLQAAQRASTLVPPNRFYIFSRMLLPAVAKTFTREAEFCAHQRTALAALAIQRYRLAHTNALPPTLDALVPAYLSAVPTSPFDGKPLHYKPRSPGYVVYSISSDGVDHGGLEPPSQTPNATHDITFILEK